MRPSRRSGLSAARTTSSRLHGRITKEDIRSAGLRRWNGRARITTDWLNLFHEPELCFSTGDVFIYLREPGQSSRGPSFRVHKERLQEKGFGRILEKCIDRAPVPGTGPCMMASCPGCEEHQPPSELYIPAPQNSDIDTIFDHHITTRNFFAWLYDLPLAGKALGVSMVALKERIDFYRPNTEEQTAVEVVTYAESQRYLDFRECIDHALAALLFAESLQLEDLWIDAFAHCVGLCHRSMSSSIEYLATSSETRRLIHKARLEMDVRLDRVNRSVENFFENDLAGNFFGLSQTARDHFDRFRSWLHGYYIEQHGFWPPVGLEDEVTQRNLHATMYSDFKNLYHHLVDTTSSGGNLSESGGVCTLQNIRAFDARHKYETLPKVLPLLPLEPSIERRANSVHRRQSWNPMTKRKQERENKNALRMQALITASNRDWSIMECHLVRRYSEFEAQTILDEFETVSLVDGRKVRWILIYTILQTLISVMQAPKQVRNTDSLSYSLCCHAPKILPWQSQSRRAPAVQNKRASPIEPDTTYLHSNHSEDTMSRQGRSQTNERRQTLPTRFNSLPARAASATRSSSLRRLISRGKADAPPVPAVPMIPKQAQYCEIVIEGYGNGLGDNDETEASASVGDVTDSDLTPKASMLGITQPDLTIPPSPTDSVPELSPPSTTSVSRESSNASNTSSNWTKGSTNESNDEIESATTPKSSERNKQVVSLKDILKAARVNDQDIVVQTLQSNRPDSKELNQVYDEQGFKQTVHINTKTWDQFLSLA